MAKFTSSLTSSASRVSLERIMFRLPRMQIGRSTSPSRDQSSHWRSVCETNQIWTPCWRMYSWPRLLRPLLEWRSVGRISWLPGLNPGPCLDSAIPPQTSFVELYHLVPVFLVPGTVFPHVRRTLFPVPFLHGHVPIFSVVRLDVGSGRTGHSNLHLKKLGPTQREFREDVPAEEEDPC